MFFTSVHACTQGKGRTGTELEIGVLILAKKKLK